MFYFENWPASTSDDIRSLLNPPGRGSPPQVLMVREGEEDEAIDHVAG